MKKGIFVATAALGLALFIAPDAHGWWYHGSDINQRFSGSTFIIDDEDPLEQTSLQNLIAKGQPGTAHTDAYTVFEATQSTDGCPQDADGNVQVRANIVTLNWTQTYRDGSLLSGSVDPVSFICTPDGIVFSGELITGEITRGTGRFKRASGTWEVTDLFVSNSGMTGRLTADFD